MNLQQITFIGSRLLAIILFFQTLPEFLTLLTSYGLLDGTFVDEPFGYFLLQLIYPIIACLGIYLFWDQAQWIAKRLSLKAIGLFPSNLKSQSQEIDYEKILHIGLILVGAFQLCIGLEALAQFFNELSLNKSFSSSDTSHIYNMRYYAIVALVNLIFSFMFLVRPDKLIIVLSWLRGLTSSEKPNQAKPHD